jgi:hypothetical protein
MEKCGYGNFNHQYNVSYSLACNFGCGEFYEGGLLVRQLPMRWSAIARSLRNIGV